MMVRKGTVLVQGVTVNSDRSRVVVIMDAGLGECRLRIGRGVLIRVQTVIPGVLVKQHGVRLRRSAMQHRRGGCTLDGQRNGEEPDEDEAHQGVHGPQ